ncbi:transketolase family protein [Candidatus Parcubacteria bacterium]|nr:transketolase family protein [Candidatus Parcubacteria bacterium]MBI4385621.1 transketolase family protein [Candidatus Parcubacteria bacterium]
MLNPHTNLAPDLFDNSKLQQKPIRDGYGDGLLMAGEANPNVVALCADLSESTRTQPFQKKFPDRYVELGVAEQNMANVASGMAAMGKIPYISSYAMFSPGRNWEQIRTTIAYNNQHVVIAGAHAGVSVGPDGATHQAIEDIAIMRVVPNVTVIAPCDAIEAKKATFAAMSLEGPVYIRFAREKTPLVTTEETPFQVGRAEVFREGHDVAIVACGSLVWNALAAANELAKEGIEATVVNNHTVKPLDAETIVKAAKVAGAIVTVEEHQINGGMGSAVCEVLAEQYPVPVERIGVRDRFGESGDPNELVEHFGMGVGNIKEAVKRAIERKRHG